MNMLLILMTLQGCMGAFDTLYHHEFTERLPWKPEAGRELFIHGLRNLFYGLIFASLGWVAWGGPLAGIFAAMLLGEIGLTLWDFVIEDRTRALPASERITHTILAINYGAVLACLAPELLRWAAMPAGFHAESHGLWSWVMTLFAAGVWAWAAFDLTRSGRFRHPAAIPPPHLEGEPQRVLVTGGTGLIGSRLVQGLIDDGHSVTVLTRDKRRATHFRGPVTLVDSLDDIRAPIDIVVNLAGEPLSSGRWTMAKKRRMYESRLDLTKAVVDWIAAGEIKSRHLVNASAVGAYGHSDDREFREDSLPGDDDLGRDLCARWEAVANQATAFGTRVSLLRFGIVLSLDGGALAQMLMPFEFGLGGPIGSGRQWISWIHIDDAVGLIAHVVNAGLEGPVNATAPEPRRNHDFTRALARAMRRPGIMPLPGFVIKLLLGEMGETILLNGQKVVPAKALDSGYSYAWPTLDGAFGALFQDRISSRRRKAASAPLSAPLTARLSGLKPWRNAHSPTENSHDRHQSDTARGPRRA
jgi:hypothetical protein